MSRKKTVLWVLGSGVALGAIAIGLAFTPAVQTWAVRRAVSDLDGTVIHFDRVAAGLSSARVTGLRVRQSGLVVEVPQVDVAYSAVDYLTSGKLHIVDLVARGAVIDLAITETTATSSPSTPPLPSTVPPAMARPGGAPALQASEPFQGLLRQIVLPLDLRLDRLETDGTAQIDATRRVSFSVQGGGLATGAEARFTYKGELTDSAEAAPVRRVNAEGEISVALDANRGAERGRGQVTATAQGEGIPSEMYTVVVEARRLGSGDETYNAAFLRGDGVSSSPLVALDARFEPTVATLSGHWTVALPREALGSVLSGLNLPDLAADGRGAFSMNTTTSALTTTGELRGEAARLETLSPELGPIGSVRFATGFEVGVDSVAARLARLSVEVSDAAGTPLVEVRSLQPVAFAFTTQALTLTNPDSELARVAVRTLPAAWMQPWAAPYTLKGGELSLAFDVAAAADGSRMEARTAEPLSVRNLTVYEGDQALVEELTLSAYPKITYVPGAATVRLDRLELATSGGDALQGMLEAAATSLESNPKTTFSAKLDGRLAGLHRSYVPMDAGLLTFGLDVAGSHSGNDLELDRLALKVGRDGAGLLADVTLRAPLKVNLANDALLGAPGLSATITLGSAPLAWAQPFVAGFTFNGDLTGGSLEFAMTSPDDLTANVVAPLTFRGVDVSENGETLVQGLDLATMFTATWRDQRLTYDVREFEASQAGASILRTKVAGHVVLTDETPQISARGTIAVDAAALGRQPVAAPYAYLSRGRVTGEFQGSYEEALKAQATVAVRQAVARAGNQSLGDVDLTVNAELKADGSGSIQAPLKVVAGERTSELTVTGTYRHSEQGLVFEGTLDGRQVVVDDLQAFTALVPASETAPAPASPAPTSRSAVTPAPRPGAPTVTPAAKPDAKPFWAGASGRLVAKIDVLRYGSDVVNGLNGTFVLSEDRLALETFEGRLKDDPFKFAGGLTFDPRQARPYALAGTVNVSNLDLGAILLAANPREKPSIETKVTAVGNLSGQGATLEDVLQRIQGTFDVKGTGGVLRALGRRGEAMGAVSGLLGLAGALSGSTSTAATAELASQLNEMRFDSMTMKVERGADLNVKLLSMEFLSPTSRLSGSGTIRYQEGVPLAKQSMNMQFQLAGKGALAQVLERVGLLSGQQDDREYFTMRHPLAISGTPMSTDTRDLWATLLQTALRMEAERRNAAAARRQAEAQEAQKQQGAATPGQGGQSR